MKQGSYPVPRASLELLQTTLRLLVEQQMDQYRKDDSNRNLELEMANWCIGWVDGLVEFSEVEERTAA